jgi:tetratricopeptide (TPR) repeat protein
MPSIAENPDHHTVKLSRWCLWSFRLLAFSIPFLLLSLVEIAFRLIPGTDDAQDPYVNISPVSVFSKTTIDGQEYYKITHRWVLDSGNVRFLVKKPTNTIRIFCLGSSACAGWPHPQTETFSAYLQQALEAGYPGTRIEVINAAGHGFAAYRDRRVLDEVIQMQPDAIIVWEGNNEFLEDRTYDSAYELLCMLSRYLKTARYLRSVFITRTDMSGTDLKHAAQFFWKKARRQSLRLREDPVQFAHVREHFRISFEYMVDQSRRHHVPIVLCTVPVNLRDWLPTVSCNRLAGEERTKWEKLYNQARRDLLEGKYKDGIQILQEAHALETEHAESYFWLGRLLEAEGQKAAAWEAYSKARDQDYNPFRAVSAFNETIRELARRSQNEGVFLLDLERIFADASIHAAPGFDLFLDYVHPTKPGNLLVAESAYRQLIRDGVLKDKPATDHFTYSDVPSGFKKQAYRDETDQQLQLTVISLATLNHQYETIVSKSEAFIEHLTGRKITGLDDPFLKRYPPEFAERYRVFRNHVDVERRVIRGQPVSEAEEKEAAKRVNDFYEKWYP